MHRYIYHLPWPVSVNRMWRNTRRTTLSARARLWYEQAGIELIKQTKPTSPIEEPVSVDLFIVRPWERKEFDVDNMLKCVLDLLVKSGVLAGDSWRNVRSVSSTVSEFVERPGSVVVDIRPACQLYRRGGGRLFDLRGTHEV